jgi:hypothetical protein
MLGSDPVGTMVVGVDGQCYQLGVASINQPQTVAFSGYSTASIGDCNACTQEYPCQSTPTPTPTVTPTNTPVYKWKLLNQCCEFGYPESVTIYTEANLLGGINSWVDGSYAILDGVVYQIQGPQLGSASYTPSQSTGTNGIYTSCQQAFASGYAYEQCAPEPTPSPQCECYYGSQISYACASGQLCPPSIQISYTDCEDGSSGNTFTLSQGETVSLARCVVEGSIVPTSQLLPSQNLNIEYAGICCSDVTLDFIYRVTRCGDQLPSTLLGPTGLASGTVVRSTDGSCWTITGSGVAPASYTYVSTHQSCQDCLS